MTDQPRPRHIDELLDQAFAAINAGDRERANDLAERVLQLDEGNMDAEDLLAAPDDPGEIRRLTIMFADLVDSTALSTRIEPEVYRTVVGRYRDEVLRDVRQYEGHIGSTKGDGLLAFFGHPQAHEDDVQRAVQAGLDITRSVAELSARVRQRFGFDIAVRVGIHRGIVYLDTRQDDVYGLAANLAARICSIAEPGTVSVSEAVEPLISGRFELEARLPVSVKGVDHPVSSYRVIGERDLLPVRSGPLIGRDAETTYLREVWKQACANEPHVPGVAFFGDAGIGKSRLAWSAVDLAEQSHAVVLQLVGSPFHTDVGLRPIRRLLERRCGITRTSHRTERLTSLTREVLGRGLDPAEVIPLLAPILGIGPEAGYEQVPVEGRKLFELISVAVQQYLLSCVRGAPALVLVEDMHWFDEDTVEAVQLLLASDLGDNVVVVMTSRQPLDLPDSSLVRSFELKPLTKTDADQLITAIHPEVTTAQKKAVQSRCDGVPLYIEEVVAKLKSQPTDIASSAGVPDTLYEALFARLRPSESSVRVVEAAAIIGSRIERGLLLTALNLPEQEVDAVLQQLVDSSVLDPLEQDTWRFRHELLREVGAELAPPSLRRELHSRIADSMAAGSNPDWPLIARHYENADRFVEASASYGRASLDAWHRGALGEARTYMTYSINQIERPIGVADRDRMEIALRLHRALLTQAAEGVASPAVAADFERCLELSRNDLQDDDLFSTMMSLYPYYTMRADLDRAERLVQSIRTGLTGHRARFLPINEFALGMLAWYRGDFDYAAAKMTVAVQTVTDDAVRDLNRMLFMPNDATAGLFTHRALSHYVAGDIDSAEADLKTAETRCARKPFPQGAFSLAYTRQIEVIIRIETNQLERAAEVATGLAILGDQHGFDSWTLVGSAQHACVAGLIALRDNSADAPGLAGHIDTITSFVEMWRALGVISLITFYDALLARLLIGAHDLSAAAERLDIALRLADETGMHFYDAELLRLRAQTRADRQKRRDDLTAATVRAHSQGARLFELRSLTDLFAVDRESARPQLSAVLESFPAGSTWPEVLRAQELLE